MGFLEDKDNKKFKKAYFERYKNVWHHGDFIIETSNNSFVVEGRSDATLNPGGIRIGTADIYSQTEKFSEILEAVVVETNDNSESTVTLFLKLMVV